MKKSLFYNILLTGSNFVFPLLTFPYLSRIVGAEGLGVCNFILSYCQNFIIIAALGLSVYGVREIASVGSDVRKRSVLFYEILVVHIFLTVILLCIYFASLSFYNRFDSYKLLTIAGGLFILSQAFSIEWLFFGVSDFKYITIRSLVIKLLTIVAVFLFVKKSTDVSLYFLIYVLQFVVTALTNLNYAKKYVQRIGAIQVNRLAAHFKPLLVLGMYIVLTKIYTILPTTLLGFLSSTSAVGYFYTADKIVRIFISFFGAVSAVLIPNLNSLLHRDDKSAFIAIIEKSMNFVIILGIPITLFVYLFAKPLTMVFAGQDFLPSIICIKIMAPVILLVAFGQIFCLQILSVFQKDSLMVLLALIGMILGLVINLIFIPRYHQNAVAVSQLLCESLVTIISLYFVKKYINISFPLKKFIYNLFFTLPFFAISYVLYTYLINDLLILICATTCCTLYFGVYQFLILKDTNLIKLVKPYRLKFYKLKPEA
ncbi:oligosaccharide flippase family protein [Flavitalea sp.]